MSKEEDTFIAMLGELQGPTMGFFSRARTSGFPPPMAPSPALFNGGKSTSNSKRPFDDTMLNLNNSIIQKRRRKSLNGSDISSESEHEITIGTPWEVKHLRSELTQAQAEIAALEANISQLHGVRREAELVLENEKTILKTSLDHERANVKELEKRVKMLKRREIKLREELDSVVSNVNHERKDRELRSIDLHEENTALKNKLITMEKEKNDLEIKLKSVETESKKFQTDTNLANDQLALVNEQVEQLRKSVNDFEVNKAALSNAQHRIKELESELISHKENAAVVQIQQSKLNKYAELERRLKSLVNQNNKLRESSTNSFYLESVVEELKSKLGFTEERERQILQIKGDLSVLEMRLDEFKKLTNNVSGVGSSAEDLANYIRKLQSDTVFNSSQISQLKTRLQNMEEINAKLNGDIERKNAEMINLKKENDDLNTKIKKIKKLNAFITMERNDLRSLVDSCQKEVTINTANDPRIDVLEKLVENYRKKFQELESNPNLLPDTSESKVGSEMEKLKSENDAMKEKLEKLEYELAHRALKGDFNNMNTKILHFKNNPLSEAISKHENEVDVLRKENLHLKERLRLIKEGEADITQNIANIISSDNSKEFQELKEKYKSQELQNQRLKEAFKKSLQEFREAIFSLFGYKIDGLSNKVFRLTSLYAETQEHHLIFKMSSSGEMEMLENEFSKTLTELIELILLQHHSIPVFLSSLTIDLFKRQTNSVLDSTVQQNY